MQLALALTLILALALTLTLTLALTLVWKLLGQPPKEAPQQGKRARAGFTPGHPCRKVLLLLFLLLQR